MEEYVWFKSYDPGVVSYREAEEHSNAPTKTLIASCVKKVVAEVGRGNGTSLRRLSF